MPEQIFQNKFLSRFKSLESTCSDIDSSRNSGQEYTYILNDVRLAYKFTPMNFQSIFIGYRV